MNSSYRSRAMKSGRRMSPSSRRKRVHPSRAALSVNGVSSNPTWSPRTRTSSRHRKSCWSLRSYRHTATLANAFGPPAGRRCHRVASHPSARVRALWFRLSLGTAPLSTRARAFSNVSAAGAMHARAVSPYRHLFLGEVGAMEAHATAPRIEYVSGAGLGDVLAVDHPTRGREPDRLPERGGLRVPREDLEVDPVHVHRLRLCQEADRHRPAHALPTPRGVHEEVVHDEEPPELRGRRVHGEDDADDRLLLSRDEEGAGEPALQDLLDSPRDPLGFRLPALRGNVRRDEPLDVRPVRNGRPLDEDHRRGADRIRASRLRRDGLSGAHGSMRPY